MVILHDISDDMFLPVDEICGDTPTAPPQNGMHRPFTTKPREGKSMSRRGSNHLLL